MTDTQAPDPFFRWSSYAATPDGSDACAHETRRTAVDPSTCGATIATAGKPTVGPVVSGGSELGVTELEGLDAGLLPTPFVAVTVKVYGVPLVSPLTVHEVVAVWQVKPSGAEVAV